jgi:AcrR family transcriptional regulator
MSAGKPIRLAAQDGALDSRARRYDPAETRARVIEAGFMLFATRGYAATGTADIAREADVSEGSIFYHFGSKRALLAELGRVHGGRMIAAMQEGDSLETLHPATVVRRCFAFCQTDSAFSAMKGRMADALNPDDCAAQHQPSPEAEPFFLASREVVQHWVEAHIEAYCRARGIEGVDPAITASMTFALVGDALHQAKCGLAENYNRICEQCARLVAVGCGADYSPL